MHARTPRFLILTTILAMRVIQPMDDAETCRRKIDTTYDSRGLNALHCAAQEKNHMRLQHILEQGANPFAKTRNMLALSPLRLALRVFCDTNTPHTPDAFDGDHARRIEDNADCAFETIAALLNALREHTILHQRLVLAELNEADSTGNTPLHHLLDSACNHREALFAAVLIKDNHLALGASALGVPDASLNAPPVAGESRYTPAEAVRRAREWLASRPGVSAAGGAIVEVEVDTLAQLETVLPARPDIVLLDNMDVHMLSTAVDMRNRVAAEVELEASGGVTLETIRRIAETGVERISVGALTHSAVQLDVALDWL